MSSKAGSTRVGMREVAAHADVAISSVSRVLAGHPDVSEAMRERVWRAAAELGYTPDSIAQSLRRGQTFSVGFVAANIHNPLLADIAKGAESVLRAAGYSLLIADSEGAPEGDIAALETFDRRRVDGLLLSLTSEAQHETVAWLERTKTPLVLVDRAVASVPRASAVLSDHRRGLLAAVGHLLDLGHRRIALISGGVDLRPSREREAALHEAYIVRGIPDASIVLTGRYSVEHAERSAAAVLDSPEPPTAFVAGGNQLLVGLLRALRARGIAPGEGISVVTCDDTDLTGLMDPPIAAVSRDTVAIGRAAGALLLRLLQGGKRGERVVLPTSFTATASCRPPAETA